MFSNILAFDGWLDYFVGNNSKSVATNLKCGMIYDSHFRLMKIS